MAPAATKRIITELVKCKAIRPGTPDLSLIILIPENTVPLELGSCLLGAGVNRDTSEHPPCLNAERSCVPSNQGEAELRSQANGPNWETSELLTSESNHLDSFPVKDKDGPFSLINWIKKNINLPVYNLQSIAVSFCISTIFKHSYSYFSDRCFMKEMITTVNSFYFGSTKQCNTRTFLAPTLLQSELSDNCPTECSVDCETAIKRGQYKESCFSREPGEYSL